MTRPGSEYETLVQRVFSEIVNQHAVETITVEKNKVLHGKATDHEIDVYWRFRYGGIEYETVIQAKGWAATVPQREILKFKGILDDLPNQPRGVFVTRTGYQASSVAVAEANGTILYELREPIDEDWKGRLRKISITMHFFVPGMTLKGINFDEDWIREQTRQKGVANLKFSATGPGTSIWLCGDLAQISRTWINSRRKLCLDSLLLRLLRKMSSLIWIKKVFSFEPATNRSLWLRSNPPPLPSR